MVFCPKVEGKEWYPSCLLTSIHTRTYESMHAHVHTNTFRSYSVKHEKKIYVKVLKLKKNCQIYRDKKEVVIANRGGGVYVGIRVFESTDFSVL